MTQEKLNALHEGILTLISHYLAGILTVMEFKKAIDSIQSTNDLSNLIDPATGLRYPEWMNK